MADITFKFKRGSSGGSSPSGLTHGELAVNTTDNRLFVGSVTGSVNAVNNRFFTGISTPSYPIEGDRWYTGTEEKFYYNGNWVTAGGASGSSGSSFDPTQLLVFNSGVSGSGGATFAGGTRFYGGAIVQSGGLSVTGGATITGGVALYGTITVNGAQIISNVPLASSSATGVASFGNEFSVSVTGTVSLTANYVKSVNGSTGAVLSIATTGSNTFTGLQTLNAGLTTTHLHVSNGATFANGLVVQAGGISITGGLNVSSGTISGTLATAAQTNITSVGTLTKLEVGSGGISSAGGITGTLNTAAQPNITSVGTLTSLSSSGLVTASGGITSNHLHVTNGVTFASTSVHTGLGTFNAGITSSHLYVTNGVTFAGTSVHTGLGTFNAGITSNHLYVSNGVTFAGTSVHTGLVTFNAGLTTTHLHVTNGVTFAGTSVHTGLGTFNAGITSSHLYVTNGATFANGLVVQAGGISITGGATLTGGVAVYGGLNVSSGTISGTLATAAQPNITSVGTLTRLDVGSGGISSAGGITGTLNTAAQTNITSVGTLTSLSSSGLVTASGGITSNHLYVTNGVTFAGTSVHTGLGTFNAGITSSHLYVTSGVTFAGTSVHTGLGTFNAGLTTTHLHVTNGATFTGTVSAGTISAALNGNASTATTLETARTINQTSFNGSSNINIDQMFRADKRTISPTGPSGVPAGYSQFVFTTWNNTLNTTPYADGIHFRTYQDASGGKDNLLVLNKSVIGMRLWQQEFGSATAYTAYKDVAFIQDVVTSFNGLTGAVSGVTTSAANTFTALNTFNAGITSTHLYVTNGVTFAGTSVHTGLGTFNNGISVASGGATFVGTSFSTGIATPATFNGGLVSNTINVVSGVTFGSTSYHAGLGTFNEGITSNHLYVSKGATFASGLSVTGGTAYFFRDVYLATGANHPGIVDYEFAANTGITYPSASTPAYTVGDKWSNGSIEYTWNGSAWIENTDNIFSSTPIDFNSIVPSQSITRAKLSPSAPFFWNSTHFFPGKMSWGSSATDTVELPAGSITAAGYQNGYQLTTKQYVDDAVQGVVDWQVKKHITKVTALLGQTPFPDVQVPFTDYPVMGRRHYVKWSMTTFNNNSRSGTLTLYSPFASPYGIEVFLYYPPTTTNGSPIMSHTVTTYDKLLPNGNYYADNGNPIIITVTIAGNPSPPATIFGTFAYEIVPSLLAFNL